MTIFERLNQARTRFNEMDLKKSGHNRYADYRYFELGDFLPVALKLFEELQMTALIRFDGNGAVMQIVDSANPDGPSILFTSPMADAVLKGCHPIQNLGAMHTYMRRYLWVLALEITEHDPLDSLNGSDRGFDPSAVYDSWLNEFENMTSVVELRKMLTNAKNALKAYPNLAKQLQDEATRIASRLNENAEKTDE